STSLTKQSSFVRGYDGQTYETSHTLLRQESFRNSLGEKITTKYINSPEIEYYGVTHLKVPVEVHYLKESGSGTFLISARRMDYQNDLLSVVGSYKPAEPIPYTGQSIDGFETD